MDRVISTGNTTAYLKIAEGCSNRCTYCAIPYIRGPQISRKIEDIIKEANGQKKIIRIYSTNPQAYLVFQPGQMIQDGNESVR